MILKNKLTVVVNFKNVLSLAILIYMSSHLALAANQNNLDPNQSIIKLGNINYDFGVTDKEKNKPLIIFYPDEYTTNDTPYMIGDVLSIESLDLLWQFKKKYQGSIAVTGSRNSLEYKFRTLVVDFKVWVPYSTSKLENFPDTIFNKYEKTRPKSPFAVAQSTCTNLRYRDCSARYIPASSISDLYIKREIMGAKRNYLIYSAVDKGGHLINIYDYYTLSTLPNPSEFWKNVEENQNTYKKGKYNVSLYFIPSNVDVFGFKAFDTLDEAKKYIDDYRAEQFKAYEHNYAGNPSMIIQPDGYVYYRGYDLDGKKDNLSLTKVNFLNYLSSPPAGKYYFQDDLDVDVVYGSSNRYYAFDSLDEALNSLGVEYTDVVPTSWGERTDGDYRNYQLSRFPYKLYPGMGPKQSWVFGTRVGALYGPNGKLVANFHASRGGSNCQFWVGTQYAKYAAFWQAVIRDQTPPIGEQKLGCDRTSSDEIQPGLIGQPGFPAEYPRLPPWPTLDLRRK